MIACGAHCAGRRALRVEKANHRGCSGLKDVQHCHEDASACLLFRSGLSAGLPQPSRAFPAGALLCIVAHCCSVLEARRLGLVILHVFVAAGEPVPLGMQAGAALPDVPLSQLSQAL